MWSPSWNVKKERPWKQVLSVLMSRMCNRWPSRAQKSIWRIHKGYIGYFQILHSFIICLAFARLFRMQKSGRLFQSITRAAILLNRPHIRYKTQYMDYTVLPAPFYTPPTIVIKSPYSVKVEAIDPLQFGHLKAVVGFLYLETETDKELSPEVKTAFQQDVQYDVKAVMSPTRDYMEVRGHSIFLSPPPPPQPLRMLSMVRFTKGLGGYYFFFKEGAKFSGIRFV